MRDEISKNDNHIVRTFDSWAEAITFADQAPPTPRAGRSSRDADDWRDWHGEGASTWGETVKLARAGWLNGAARADAISSAMFASVSSKIEREEIVYDVEGVDFDVAMVLEGEPECWQRFEYRTEEGPGRRVLRVVFNCEVSGGLSTQTIEARGGAVLAVVQLLEYAGHGVELWIAGPIGTADYGTLAGSKGVTSENRVLVKAADQPLDAPVAAFALAHPSMLRRVMFALQERLPERWIGPTRGGYGAILVSQDKGDVYIDGAILGQPHWTDEAATRKWILEQLKKCGVAISETAI